MNASHTLCLINGEPSAVIPADDRGLRYGDGVFETVALVDHQPVLLAEHLERLSRGCERLGIPTPSDAMIRQDLTLLDPPRFGVLRLTVTRGAGGRGYAPPETPQPNRIVQLMPVPTRPAAWWDEGVHVRDCRMTLAEQPALAGIKHLNRLEQVLARAEWQSPETAEGLMCTAEGLVIEATAANLIIDIGTTLVIPDTAVCGVDGIMQQALLREADALDIPWTRQRIHRDELSNCHGIMLCNSLVGVWSVAVLNGKSCRQSPHAAVLQTHVATRRLAPTPEVMAA